MPGFAGERDSSPASRLDRIQNFLNQANIELDSLKKDMAARNREPVFSDTGTKPIFGELITQTQRKLARATITPHHKTSAGYSFNPNLGMGMNLINWFGDWGAKLDAGIMLMGGDRRGGVNASLLRSLHRFSMIDGSLETHLYAFTGLGVFWAELNNGYGPVSWYSSPDLIGLWQLGAGTELSLLALGGVRFVPEVGLQASRYLSRYQDSPGYTFGKPKSDFALDPYFAFHINFYFR
jgi:hypothetical protein